ncbi:MAG: sigma-70 family RNA polymerase sigma factor [Planctomycetes bacterium]|nr:sigma-70 family RNA polymerase sigma factor [Planctomycetota bacterium]
MEAPRNEQAGELVRLFAERWLDAEAAVSSFIFASVRDFQHAEDLIQTVAMDAAAAIGTYDRARPFLPWIMGIARNRVLKYYRTRTGDRLVFDERTLAAFAAAHEAAADEADTRRRALDQCLSTLTGRTRDAIEWRYRSDLSAADIAARLGMTPNAVFVMLHRARQTLLDCIRKRLAEGAA